MRFLADESCDYAVVTALREAGHDVMAVAEAHAGAEDPLVLAIARDEARILVTEDVNRLHDQAHLVAHRQRQIVRGFRGDDRGHRGRHRHFELHQRHHVPFRDAGHPSRERVPGSVLAYLGCDWVDVLAQGVPAHIGTPTPGYGYEAGDPYTRSLPPALRVGVDGSEESLRAVVFVTGDIKEGTARAAQEYESPLLVLTGTESRRL